MDGFLACLIMLLLMTPYVKFYTVLTLFRHGLGLSSWGFEIIIVTLAAVFSLIIVEQSVVSTGGYRQVLQSVELQKQLEVKLEPFVLKHTDPKITEKLKASEGEIGIIKKNTAFILSQLKDAFLIGLIIMIPFLVTDLLVTNILMALGITQISAAVVSLPLKILLFIIVDGWGLLGQRLIQGYTA